jgi:hypothetical protein
LINAGIINTAGGIIEGENAPICQKNEENPPLRSGLLHEEKFLSGVVPAGAQAAEIEAAGEAGGVPADLV